MDALKKYYLLIVLILAVLGLAVQYIGSDLQLSYQKLELIENGKVLSKEILSPNPYQPILTILSSFLITLSISIFVSMFILKKLEDAEKEKAHLQLEEIRKNINQDVFNSLFKTLVPDEIYRVVKDQIIKSKLIRKNAIWIYDFKSLENDYFELKQTLKSELHNISNSSYKKDYEIEFRTSGELSTSKLERFCCEYQGQVIANLESNDDDFSQSGIHKVPLDISPGEHADITLVFKTKYKGNEIADSYFSSQALINATLITNYPEGYKFTLFPSFSSCLRETSSDGNSSIYELKGAILPGQGMSFYLATK